MDKEFLIVDNHVNNKGDITTEFKECDGKILVKHFAGINTDNFVIKKFNGKKLEFSFFKLNGVYYININGQHIIDYKKFINIQSIMTHNNDIKIKNIFIGELILQNCDVDIIQKSLSIMAEWIKRKSWWLSDLMYYFFN